MPATAPHRRAMSFSRAPGLSAMTTTTTAINKLSTVCVPVGDQDAMVAFYTDVLGLEKRTDVPFAEGYRWVEVAPPGADTTIALAPPPEGRPFGGVETGITLQTSDIDALHAELKAQGVDIDDEVSRYGDPVPPIVWLRDPEKNILMIVEA